MPVPTVNSPKSLLALALSMLLASGVLGVLNGSKLKTLRNDVNSAVAQKQAMERERAATDKAMKDREAKVKEQMTRMAQNDSRIEGAEADLVKTQTEKSDLQSKLQANETQIAELQKRIEELSKTPANPNPGAPSPAELQAQLEDARKQLESAEREKTLLSEKFQVTARIPETAIKREPAYRGSIRGTVLAVNPAYNFVVLNLGNRNGVQANAEMLVLREGSVIGKIRISSVEPATAIGDIMNSSLARGVQVQPGDTVIYAGSNS
jgi:predicted RNase H-like nuclease (RuvC/YqgF family)